MANDSAARFGSRAEFDSSLELAVKLRDDKALWWRLSSVGVEARLDKQVVDAEFGNPSLGISRRTFERVLNHEIVWALNALMNDASIESLLRDQRRAGEPGPSPEELEDIRARVEAIDAALVRGTSFKERALVRRTAKGPAFEDIRWDISVKKHDLRYGTVDDVPYATLELVYSEEPTPPVGGGSSSSAISFRRLFGMATKSVFFDCHLEDVEDIIQDLQSLKENLKRMSRRP